MFEHFGLKDALYGLWKYKLKIFVGGICICFLATLFMVFVPVKKSEMEIEIGNTEEVQTKEVYFYLQYSGNDSAVSSKVLAQMYITAMNKQECKHEVADYVLNNISKSEIVSFLNGSINESQITTNFFTQYVSASIDTTDVGITLLVRTPSREFTNILCDAYMNWFFSLVEENSQLELVILSQNEGVMAISTGSSTTVSEEQNWSVGKIVIITFVLAVLTECIIVLFIILFRPTLNRRTDFEQLGLDVLGTIKISSKERCYEKEENV